MSTELSSLPIVVLRPAPHDDRAFARVRIAAVYLGRTTVRVQTLGPVKNTITTRWLKNTAEATLWSGPDANASAFTKLPEASYLKVIGPDDGTRTPVYYVGDGLMRPSPLPGPFHGASTC